VKHVPSAAELVGRLKREYDEARARLTSVQQMRIAAE